MIEPAKADHDDFAANRSVTDSLGTPFSRKNPEFAHFGDPGIIFTFAVGKKSNGGDEQLRPLFLQLVETLSVPDADVGKRYVFIFDLAVDGLVFEKVVLTHWMSENGFGINVEKDGRVMISGTPRKEYVGHLFFGFQNTENKGLYFIHSPKLFRIHPDPRSLWLDLPVKDFDGYEKNNRCSQGMMTVCTEAGRIDMIAASVRGRSHAHVGKPRDDHFGMDFDQRTGWHFVAVADGAGSARYSRKGSEIACETVIEKLREHLTPAFNESIRQQSRPLSEWNRFFSELNGKPEVKRENVFVESMGWSLIFQTAIADVFNAICREADTKQAMVRDYHTTLLCAAFRYFEECRSWLVASYWVGDGGAAILRWNGRERVLPLGKPDSGKSARQTRFLTMKEELDPAAVRKRLRFTFCETFEAMLFLTDGVTAPFFVSENDILDESCWLHFYDRLLKCGNEGNPGCPQIDDPALSPLAKAELLLHWLDFWSKGHHDDRTALIVLPQTPVPPPDGAD